ncbi:hypothetical protein [Hoeflea sp. TYP-13]|uniref:hypothetical protein n=1 Tax=Hoeflea sp. TYP-13 TaxID=3230023 RepID=UPI0034C63FE2
MVNNTLNPQAVAAWSALAFGVAATAFALLVNTTIVGMRPLEKLAPDWTPANYSLPETAVIAISAAAGLILSIFVQNASSKPVAVSHRDLQWAAVVGLANIGFLVSGAVLTMSNAPLFRALISETGGVAIAQAILIALAVVVFIRLALKRVSANIQPVLGIPFRVVAGACALVLFVLLMEEISYGQHYIGWQTPETFSGNVQNETNLHNFYTYRFELIYYSGATIAFCLLPIWANSSNFSWVSKNRHVIPPAIFAAAAMPLTAFLFESWSIVPLQVYFFLGLALSWSLFRRMKGPERLLPVAVLAAMIACQFIYVFQGHRLVAGHEISEMRELSIAWMIFVYAVWLNWRCRTAATENQPVQHGGA